MPLLQKTDVENVRKISQSFDQTRFDTFAQAAEDQNLRVWLGDGLYYDLITNPTDAKYVTLLDGGTFQKDGDTIKFFGLRTYLAYIWLAIYADEGDEFQADIGTVNFNPNQPTHFMPKKKKVTGENYRSSAIAYKNNAIDFLDENNVTYELWRGGGKSKRNKTKWIPL